jgi:hypothetical protein
MLVGLSTALPPPIESNAHLFLEGLLRNGEMERAFALPGDASVSAILFSNKCITLDG